METKSIDQYFEQARSIPVAMSFEEVQALVKIKGVPTTHQSWWKTKKFIFMTTTAIIITSAILFFNSSEEIVQNPIEEVKQEIQQNKDLPIVKHDSFTNEENLTDTISENSQITTEKERSVPVQNEIPLIKNEVSILGPELDINIPLLDFSQNILPQLPTSNITPTDTTGKQRVLGKDSKKISKELNISTAELVVVNNHQGDISVLTWDKPTIKMEAYVTIKGGNDEDIKKALEDFDLDLVAKGGKIEIDNHWSKHHNCNCAATSIKGKIATKKGDKIKVKGYEIDYVITVPKKMNLELKDNYGNISLKDIDGDVKTTNFHGDVVVGKISGTLNLNLKYGGATIGDFKTGEITLFQSKIKIGKTDKLDLIAKYSNVDMVSANEISLTAFQSEIDIANDVKEVKGKLKYSKLFMKGNANTINMAVFQAKINVEKVTDFDVEGSYTKFKVESIENLTATSSFQNTYTIGSVGVVKGSSKYTSFDIGTLKSELNLKTFQGSIDVKEVKDAFKKLDINSKYTPIDLNFSPNSTYNINAEMTYTALDYPENLIQIQERLKENNRTTLKGVFNADNNKEPSMVSVVSFQGKLSLR